RQRGHAASLLLQEPPQSHHTVGESLFIRRETPANKALAFGPERAAGRKPQSRLAHQALAEFETIGHARDAEEQVHRASWCYGFDAGDRVELVCKEVARQTETLERMRNCCLALGNGDHAGPLYEGWRAWRVVFDQLAQIGHQRAWW